MTLRLTGVVHGRNVELERETGLPDGASVTVRIETEELPLSQQRQKLRALCGAWSDDDSIEAIFAETTRERLARLPREIDETQ